MKKNKQAKARRKKKKRLSLSTIILVVIFLAGLGVMLYPTVSDYWNSFHQSRAIAGYDQTVADMSEEDFEALMAAAEAYNTHLKELRSPFVQYKQLEEEYYNALDVTGTGIMGYITIDKIDVNLPIYHGTSQEVLNIAVGHLEGTTLPIGGAGNHAVLSAHRGLPRAKLFTDLDEMEVGDTFDITVLKQTMTYEIDQILIVEPAQLDALNIEKGEDYVTLMTCTPYGINSHRMLLRGHRIESGQGSMMVRADAKKIPAYIVMPAIAIPVLFLLLLVLLIVYRRKPKNTKLDALTVIEEMGKIGHGEKKKAKRNEKKEKNKIKGKKEKKKERKRREKP